MKKRIVSLLLCLVFCLALLPPDARADAEDTEVATYAELQSALNRGDASIRLTQDIAYNVPADADPRVSVPAGKNVTLDLNGYTLDVYNKAAAEGSGLWGAGALISLNGGASLTIRNGTIKIGNRQTRTNVDPLFAAVRGGGTLLVLENATVETGVYNTKGTLIDISEDGSVTLDTGKVYSDLGFAVTMYGKSTLFLSGCAVLGQRYRSGSKGRVGTGGDSGYGALRALYDAQTSGTPSIACQYGYFWSGIQASPEVIAKGFFTPSNQQDVVIGGTQYANANAFPQAASSPGGEGYFWRTDSVGGCALVSRADPNAFATDVEVFKSNTYLPVLVEGGRADITWAKKDTLITVTADDVPGMQFTGWRVDRGGVTLADPSAPTTTFSLGMRPVWLTAERQVIPTAIPGPIQLTDLAIPVAGDAPDESLSVPQGAHYHIADSAWYQGSQKQTVPFATNTEYTLKLRLEPEAGYAFDDPIAVRIDYQDTQVQRDGTALLVTSRVYTTQNIPIRNVDIRTVRNETNELTPVAYDEAMFRVRLYGDTTANGQPAFFLKSTANENGFVEGIRWDDLSTPEILVQSQKLLPGHRYRMAAILRPRSGYSFWLDPNNGNQIGVRVTINGVEAEVTGNADEIEAVIEIPALPMASLGSQNAIWLLDKEQDPIMDENGYVLSIPDDDFYVSAVFRFTADGDYDVPKKLMLAAAYDAAGRLLSTSFRELQQNGEYLSETDTYHFIGIALPIPNSDSRVQTVKVFCLNGDDWTPLLAEPYLLTK